MFFMLGIYDSALFSGKYGLGEFCKLDEIEEISWYQNNYLTIKKCFQNEGYKKRKMPRRVVLQTIVLLSRD